MVFFYITFAAFAFFVVSMMFGFGDHGHGGGWDTHGGHDIGHGHGPGMGHAQHGLDHVHSGGTTSQSHPHQHGHGSQSHAQKPENVSIFSFQVFMLFVAGFGIGGYFSALYQLGWLLVLGSGVGMGFVQGALGYTFLNWLHRNQGSTHAVIQDLVGQFGEVMVTIPEGGRGKVICRVAGRIQAYSAVTTSSEPIPKGSHVQVLGATGAVLSVVPVDNNQLDSTSWRQLN